MAHGSTANVRDRNIRQVHASGQKANKKNKIKNMGSKCGTNRLH